MRIKKVIELKLDELTPKQKDFARFVLLNPERLAFLSINEASAEANVSQATIFRFCTAIGYDGFIEFSQDIKQSLQKELSIGRRVQLTRQFKKGGNQNSSKFHQSLSNEIENLSNLVSSIAEDEVARCINTMTNADHFCVVGNMASFALATHFGQMLSKLKPNTDILGGADIKSSVTVSKLTEKSVVFLMLFPRYPKLTVSMGKLFKSKGAKIIVVSNTKESPASSFSDINFIIPVNIMSYVDAFTAPIAFLTSLLVEYAEQFSEEELNILHEYDDFAHALDLFETS